MAQVLFAAVSEQQEEFTKAVFSQGEYEFRNEYKYLEVSHLDWIQMSRDQRESKIQKSQKTKLTYEKENLTIASSIPISKHLSVRIEDAQISHVSMQKVLGMWEKAEQLLNGCGLVLPAAGATQTSHQVASLSAFKSGDSEVPHNITSHQCKVGTEVKCDCPVYRSFPHICQHALAAAEDIGILSNYQQWVRKTKKSLNVSQLVASQILGNAGKKPTSHRKGGPKKKTPQMINDTNTLPPTSAVPMSASTQANSQASNVTQSSGCQLNEYHPFSNVAYPPSPSDAFIPGNTPRYASAPTSHPYPPCDGYGYRYPLSSRYSYPPGMGYYPSSNHVFPPPTNPYPYPSPSDSLYPSSYNTILLQYNPISTSSNSNSGTCQALQNASGPQVDSDDIPVFTLLKLAPKMKKCYGYDNNLRNNGSNVAKPPYDVVVQYKERRYYRDPSTQALKLTNKEENTYYHFMIKCIQIKHPLFSKDDLKIPPDIGTCLQPLHSHTCLIRLALNFSDRFFLTCIRCHVFFSY